jgi:hypothetical protein
MALVASYRLALLGRFLAPLRLRQVIRRRQSAHPPAKEPLQGHPLLEEGNAASHLFPDERVSGDLRSETAEGQHRVVRDRRLFGEDAAEIPAVQLREAQKLQRGERSLAGFDVEQCRAGETDRLGRFLLGQPTVPAGVAQALSESGLSE